MQEKKSILITAMKINAILNCNVLIKQGIVCCIPFVFTYLNKKTKNMSSSKNLRRIFIENNRNKKKN